jgi:hypothetical protein
MKLNSLKQIKLPTKVGSFLFSNNIYYYSGCGASTGQTPLQAPHSIQTSASITYLSSPADIQLTGHSASQAPQLIQASLIL